MGRAFAQGHRRLDGKLTALVAIGRDRRRRDPKRLVVGKQLSERDRHLALAGSGSERHRGRGNMPRRALILRPLRAVAEARGEDLRRRKSKRRRIEERGRQVDAVRAQLGEEGRQDAGGHVVPEHRAVRPALVVLEDVEILHLVVARVVERQHLGDRGQLARSIREALAADDEMHRRRHLGPHRAQRHLDAREQTEHLEAAQRIDRRVRVSCGQRAAVAGVHRLQEVEALAAAHFADDDPVRTQAQRGVEQVADVDLALAVLVGGPALERDQVRLTELQLGRVLDGEDPLVRRDHRAERVEQRSLA